MSKNVSILDYGIGNLLSVTRAFEHCGAETKLIRTADEIRSASLLVLPGVGAFADGMRGLRERGLVGPLRDYVATGRPLLGICLGMQMLFDESEEFGTHQGLGLIRGRVVPVPKTSADGKVHKIPHIGWNELMKPEHGTEWDGTILEGVKSGAAVYFVHSFTAQPADPKNRLADAYYNGRLIAAAVVSGNIYGCQFHPEKSGKAGLQMVRNFIHLNSQVPA